MCSSLRELTKLHGSLQHGKLSGFDVTYNLWEFSYGGDFIKLFLITCFRLKDGLVLSVLCTVLEL